MRIKGITDEDFVNYKVPSLFISTASCSFKCDYECGRLVCQNGILASQPTHDISDITLCNRFASNEITKAVVFGGLEPFDQFDEMLALMRHFRERKIKCDFVIYTGYYKDEIATQVLTLQAEFGSTVVVKFGRFVPGRNPRFDSVLGVMLASDNQYAERLSDNG